MHRPVGTVPECRLVTHIKVEVNIKRPVRQDSSIEVRDIAWPVCAPADAPDTPNVRPQAPPGAAPGRFAAADGKWRRGTSRPVRRGRLRGVEQRKPSSGAALPRCLTREEGHACSSLLRRAPGPCLDRSDVRPGAGSGGELVRRDTPGQPGTRRAACPAKDAGGSECARSHGRKRQRLGGLGKPLVRPAPTALSLPTTAARPEPCRRAPRVRRDSSELASARANIPGQYTGASAGCGGANQWSPLGRTGA
jgi:hypothetical protein